MSSTAFPSALRLHLVPVPAPAVDARETGRDAPPAAGADRPAARVAPPAARAAAATGVPLAARAATPEALRPFLLPAFPFSAPVVGGNDTRAGR
jgi:hypothetical protein